MNTTPQQPNQPATTPLKDHFGERDPQATTPLVMIDTRDIRGLFISPEAPRGYLPGQGECVENFGGMAL